MTPRKLRSEIADAAATGITIAGLVILAAMALGAIDAWARMH